MTLLSLVEGTWSSGNMISFLFGLFFFPLPVFFISSFHHLFMTEGRTFSRFELVITFESALNEFSVLYQPRDNPRLSFLVWFGIRWLPHVVLEQGLEMCLKTWSTSVVRGTDTLDK